MAALRWRDGLELLDQRVLPRQERWLAVTGVAAAIPLIRNLAVRGAPAIGLTAAYALAAEARRRPDPRHLVRAGRRLAAARPTAVNLPHAVASVLSALAGVPADELAGAALAAARRLHHEDADACLAIGRHGAAALPSGRLRVLTICNAGALATGGIGTALGVVRTLHAAGRLERLFAPETRPVFQGARLTAWEAMQDGLPVTLLPDGAAPGLLASGTVNAVVVGADRIAADGAVANKVGTLGLALAAHRFNVLFLAAAPVTTFDLECASGTDIPVEQRAGREVTHVGRRAMAPAGVAVYNPAFDITPPDLITALICERGVIEPVCAARVREVAG